MNKCQQQGHGDGDCFPRAVPSPGVCWEPVMAFRMLGRKWLLLWGGGAGSSPTFSSGRREGGGMGWLRSCGVQDPHHQAAPDPAQAGSDPKCSALGGSGSLSDRRGDSPPRARCRLCLVTWLAVDWRSPQAKPPSAWQSRHQEALAEQPRRATAADSILGSAGALERVPALWALQHSQTTRFPPSKANPTVCKSLSVNRISLPSSRRWM